VSILASQGWTLDSTGGVDFVPNPTFSGNWFNPFMKLHDILGLIHDSSELSLLAAQVASTDGVYFVPAFFGNWFNPCRK
jgi:hypothetical protein